VQVMHVDSVSVLEPAVPHVPSRRKRKHRLADYQPVPKGDDCLPLVRAQELFRGKPWKPEEEEHCQTCAWCWYFVSHDERECFKSRQLLEISSGRDLTEVEWEHAATCPACAYDYDLLRQEKTPDA
jgi:hypothetical protein